MHDTVGVEVLGTTQQADKHVLGRNLSTVSKESFKVYQGKLTWVMSMAVTISPGRANP